MIKIADMIGEAAAYEQLAEECVELAHAALKYARVKRGENATPVTAEEATESVREEAADVLVCIKECIGTQGLADVGNTCIEKAQRWRERVAKDGGGA